MFASAVTTLVDMCQGATEAISPYCPSIVTAVLLALQSPNVDPKAKSDILALMGDIAIAIGGVAFEAYLPRVLQALSQAGEAILLADIYYEDNAALQQAWFSTWSSLFQSFHHKPEMLMDAIPQVRNVIVKATRTLIDKHSACYAINLLGYATCCQTNFLQFLGTFFNVLLLPSHLYLPLSCKIVWLMPRTAQTHLLSKQQNG